MVALAVRGEQREHLAQLVAAGVKPIPGAPNFKRAGNQPGASAKPCRVALREGKRRSEWAVPNEPYEAACRDFITAMLAMVKRVALPGAPKTTSTLLALKAPG